MHKYENIPNWPDIRERYLAFWNRKVLDNKPIVQIQNRNPAAPDETAGLNELSEADYIQPDRLFELQARRKSQWNWHADLFDYSSPSVLSHNHLAQWRHLQLAPVWSDKPLISFQDDLAINVSPGMYEDIFLPALRRIASHAEHSSLHWHDGARQHIDWIAGTKEIDLVQWGHDPASPPFRKALPDMRKIQESGKKLFISCVETNDVRFFLENLDPRGLIMIINTDSDEESAGVEELVQNGLDKVSCVHK